jgi:ABC-type transport system involved in cytochrome c biogenesis permease subunit
MTSDAWMMIGFAIIVFVLIPGIVLARWHWWVRHHWGPGVRG